MQDVTLVLVGWGPWEGVKGGGCPSWVLMKPFMRSFLNLMDLLWWLEGG